MNARAFLVVVTGVLLFTPVLSAAEPRQIEITVQAMHCKGCGQKMAAQLYTVPGVKSVRVDMNRKTLIVVPQEGKALSPRRLCRAAEHTESRVVQLVDSHGTLQFEHHADLPKGTANGNDRTQVIVRSMHDKSCAQKIASQLYTVSGVKTIHFAVNRQTLYVTPADGHELSLWALWEAVQKANHRASEIRGPTGSMRQARSAPRQQRRGHVLR